MTVMTIHHRSSKTLARWLASAAGALALGASMPGFAGEALDIELPSMRTPIENATPVAVQPAVSVQTADAVQAAAAGLPESGPLTRAAVRESLKTARAANTITPSGEMGDTPEVLAARENFYAAQTEQIHAQYAAAAQREQALREQVAAAEARQSDTVVAELMSSEAAAEEGLVLSVLNNGNEVAATPDNGNDVATMPDNSSVEAKPEADGETAAETPSNAVTITR